jgi:hypothetical protein
MKKDKAQLIFKLAYSKKNWGGKYNRLEHFKRFSDLKQIVKELEKAKWSIVKKKPNYTGISLNQKFKKEIVEFIKEQLPEIKSRIL